MQVQTWRQAVWLANEGVNQHVLTIGFPGLPKIRKLHEHLTVERALIPMFHIRSEFSGLIGLTQSWATATLLNLIRKGRQHNFDIIHVHLDGQIPSLLVSFLAPIITKCPLILTVHCSRLAVYSPSSRLDKVQHPLAQWLERKAVGMAHAMITLTKRTGGQLSKHARHVEIIPDIVDTSQFTPPTREVIDKFRENYNLRRRTVGFVGRIASEKGWTHLIPLALELREQGCELLIVGDGVQRNKLLDAVKKADLEDWVTITGFIPNHDIPVAIASCCLIVMPSEYEEFGGVSIEALSIGIPVVAFAVGGLSEILHSITPDLLVEPENTEALISRVSEVLAGNHLLSTQPAQLRNHIKNSYTPSIAGNKPLNLYNFILRNQKE